MTEAKTPTRGENRRQAMLEAATALFLEKGFERTTLSDIVSRSKGSRSTLYEQFGNKEGLLRAMIEDITDDIWDTVYHKERPLPFTEEGLTDLARRFVTAALSPRAIAVFRILVAEGPRLPEIAAFFIERGPRTAERLLAQEFQRAIGPGQTHASPEQMAQVFLGASLGVFHPYKVVGCLPKEIEAKIESHIPIAVKIFLHGIGYQVPA